METTPFGGLQPVEQVLAELVVGERAAALGLTHPEDAPAPGIVERGGHPGGLPADECDRKIEIELLAEDRADLEEAQRLRREEVEPARQDECGVARSLHVGHGARVDLPALGGVAERSRLDHAAEDGGRHERAPVGELHHGGDGLGGHGPGHRLAQSLDVGVLERAQ